MTFFDISDIWGEGDPPITLLIIATADTPI